MQRRLEGARVNKLASYLLKNLYFDFQGAITIDEIRQFLREDDSREARMLLSKLIEDNGVDDLMVTVADCLNEHIRSGISEDTVTRELVTYSES